MKILTLDIENFLAIGKAELPLDDRGLLLIQGDNRDDPSSNSNGAGKSTIVEALSWALYGKTAKGLGGDEVINAEAGKGTKVEVVVRDGDDDYLITRYRKHAKGKNRLEVYISPAGGHPMALTKGTDRLTQAMVEEIIGCPHEVFVAAVYAGQEAMPDLPAMTDKHLKLLIEEAAGITTLEKAYEITRKRVTEAARDGEALEAEVDRLKTKVQSALERVEDAKRSKARWDSERDERVRELTEEAKDFIKEARVAAEWLDQNPKQPMIDAKIAELDKALAGLKGERDELEKLEADASKSERAAASAKSTAQHLVQDAQDRRQQCDKVKSAIGQPCGSCGRAHDESSLCDAIAAAERALGDADAKARQSIDAAKSARTSAALARERVDEFARTMTDASATSAERSSQASLRADVERHALTRDRAKKAAMKRKEAIDAEKGKANPYIAETDARKQDVTTVNKKLQEARKQSNDAAIRLDALRQVAEIFGPKGVRAHVLDTVTPFLNAQTATYLGALSDGCIEAVWQTLTPNAKGELREKFTIEVTKEGGGQNFAALSGGEKRKVRIGCALALQDLVASRATKPIACWIGDEIDAALDTAGLERLMNVLADKARERGTVLVISHSDLRDWINQTLTVVRENGVSSIA